MVPFAGYEMPVQYEGIIAEHLWTRENAGLFDVSHMGQLLVHGQNVDVALETLMPGDFQAASDMKPKYSLLLDDNGGIIDDLMATRRGSDFYVVVNGATKHGDIQVMRSRLPGSVRRIGMVRTSFAESHSLRTALPPLALKDSTTQWSSSVTLDFRSVVAPRVPFIRA